MTADAPWDPWSALLERPEIDLDLVAGLRAEGLALVDDVGPRIVLDADLPDVAARAVLAHELVHHERGVPEIGAPDGLVAVEEREVRRETARRLVPRHLLARFVADRPRGEPVTVAEVAAHFGVPPATVADLAPQDRQWATRSS